MREQKRIRNPRVRLSLSAGSVILTSCLIASAVVAAAPQTAKPQPKAQPKAQDAKPDPQMPKVGKAAKKDDAPPSVVVPLPLPPANGKPVPQTDQKTVQKIEALPPQPQSERKLPDANEDPQKPIISDSDFAAALPPVEETAAPEPAPAPKTEPGTGTGTASGTESAPLPAVTAVDDSELQAPLQPLDSFDVQPLQASSTPEPDTPQITYVTTIDGLKEIGAQEQFKELSALQSGKGKAANAAMVRARANEDQALALRLMKSAGYYDGTVSATITAPADGKGPVEARLIAVPGNAYKLGAIAIDARPTTPPDLIRSALPLKSGDVIVANQVLAAEANVGLVLPQKGYPFAKVLDRDISLDPETSLGDYTLKVDTGNRARFGKFTTDGKLAFNEKHIAVLRRFDSGDLYDSRAVDDLRQALISTSLFRTVAVEAVPTGVIDADGVEVVDLDVHQQAGPARTLAAEIGYSTGEGFTAEGTWTHRNLFPPEGALIVNGKLGTQEQGFGATFRRSNDHQRDRTFQLAAAMDHSVYASYNAYTFGLTGSIARVSTPIWQKIWTWSYGLELLASREKATTAAASAQFSDYYLLTVPMKLAYDRSDNLLNPLKGFRLSVQGTPQISLKDGGSNLRTLLDGSYYLPIDGKIVIAARARMGSLLGTNLLSVAPSRRLYAGGGGSVRGFAYQGLGPLDASGHPTGGRSLVEGSVELRYRWGDYGIVPFIDVGQVYDSTVPKFSDMRVGIGVGARLYSNFGPIRIDIASPLNRRPTEPQFTLYVGIGQAF